MKKTLVSVTLAIMLLFTGCSTGGNSRYPTDNAYHTGTDCQYYLSTAVKSGYIAQSSSAYYMLIDNYLLTIDMDNMNAVPLCSKYH